MRASLTAYTSFFRNLPVLYILYGRGGAACALENDEDSDYYTSKCAELSDGTLLALGIGICQLLDAYSKACLDSQYLCSFPTTVISSVKMFQQKLEKWGNEWIGKKMICVLQTLDLRRS